MFILFLGSFVCFSEGLLGQVTSDDKPLVNAVAILEIEATDCLDLKLETGSFVLHDGPMGRHLPDTIREIDYRISLTHDKIEFLQPEVCADRRPCHQDIDSWMHVSGNYDQSVEAVDLSPYLDFEKIWETFIDSTDLWEERFNVYREVVLGGLGEENQEFFTSVRLLYAHLYSDEWIADRAKEVAELSDEATEVETWEAFLKITVLKIDAGTVFNRVWVSRTMTVRGQQVVAVFKSFEYEGAMGTSDYAECEGDGAPLIGAPQLSFYLFPKAKETFLPKLLQTVNFSALGDVCHDAIEVMRLVEFGPSREIVVAIISFEVDGQYLQTSRLSMFFADLPLPANSIPTDLRLAIHRLNQEEEP